LHGGEQQCIVPPLHDAGDMPGPSRRALYRIAYPLTERPTLEVGRSLHEVVDCSERGLRYEGRERRLPALGTPLGGTVSFRSGGVVTVTGEVIRTRAGLVVLALDPPGIPFGEIIAEQRYLRSKGYMMRED